MRARGSVATSFIGRNLISPSAVQRSQSVFLSLACYEIFSTSRNFLRRTRVTCETQAAPCSTDKSTVGRGLPAARASSRARGNVRDKKSFFVYTVHSHPSWSAVVTGGIFSRRSVIAAHPPSKIRLLTSPAHTDARARTHTHTGPRRWRRWRLACAPARRRERVGN